MPDPNSFSLRPLQSSDAAPIQRLWTHRFGGAPSTQKKWINAALTSSHSAVGVVAVAPSNDEVIGTSFLDVGSREYTRQYLGLDILDVKVPLANRNGIFHLSCVRADWDRQGIGSAFYERRFDVLTDRGVPRAFGVSWHRSAPVDSRVLFEKYQFTHLATIERFYSRTGTRPNCPVCMGSCTCPASLYGRPVDCS